jgi:hypothetical protein
MISSIIGRVLGPVHSSGTSLCQQSYEAEQATQATLVSQQGGALSICQLICSWRHSTSSGAAVAAHGYTCVVKSAAAHGCDKYLCCELATVPPLAVATSATAV